MAVSSKTILAGANLSKIAYDGEQDDLSTIKKLIEADLPAVPGYANGPWQLVWGPADNDGVLSYVAQGLDGTFALAIRGTLSNESSEGFFTNVFADAAPNFIPWLYPQTSQANVASGSNGALALLIASADPTTGVGLLDFLRETASHFGNTATLLVTGHSLGGNLANLAALWLVDQLPRVGGSSFSVVPCTFAATTTGDDKFAALWGTRFGTNSYGAVNTNDIVPMAWAKLKSILPTYSPGNYYAPTALYEYAYGTLYDFIAGAARNVSGFVPVTPERFDQFDAALNLLDQDWVSIAGRMHSLEETYLPYVQANYGPSTST